MSTVNRSALIAQISSKTKIPYETVAAILQAEEEIITQNLAKGNSVKLMGFLSLEPMIRTARTLKSPRTGENITIPEKKAVRIRAMKNLRDRIAEGK